MKTKQVILFYKKDTLQGIQEQLDYLYQYDFNKILVWTDAPRGALSHRGMELAYCSSENSQEMTQFFLGEQPFFFIEFTDKFHADLWEMETHLDKDNIVVSTSHNDLGEVSQTFLYANVKALYREKGQLQKAKTKTVFSELNINFRKKTTGLADVVSEIHQGGWTLFLDRDGVINKRILDNYVKFPSEFEFIEGSDEAISVFNNYFDRVVVVTNQQGIGKNIMRSQMLSGVHEYMCEKIEEKGGKIHKCYYCPDLASLDPKGRKPNIGMALQAQNDFPEIDFSKSVMVGDSISDIRFGNRLGMITVFVETKNAEEVELSHKEDIDYRFSHLAAFAKQMIIPNSIE